MLNFEDFKKMALSKNLKTYEKVGFTQVHRKDSEKNIFPDILLKLNIKNKKVNIMDIGCGCSKPVFDLIKYCKKNGNNLYLVDSKEMLSNLPDEKFITKIECEFPNCKQINELKGKIDYIIIYSVLHHVVTHGNYVSFLDTAVELVKYGGRLLLADLPNVTKKKRFLSSCIGKEFHKKWANTEINPEVDWNELDKHSLDDSLIFSILQRYRNMGCETYLLEQMEGLSMNNSREDILIRRN